MIREKGKFDSCPFLFLLNYKGYSSNAYKIVDKYLSPVSGNKATIVFPAFSGRCANCVAAYTAAPEDIPTSNPSF